MTPHRLVSVDETSTNAKMTRLRGRALCGDRLRALAPFGRWGTQTFIAGLRLCGLTAPWVLDGPITRAAFNVYVETQLAPTLDKGDVVMLDNLSSHKSETAAECLKEKGAWFLFNRRLLTRWVSRKGGRIVAHMPENARFSRQKGRQMPFLG